MIFNKAFIITHFINIKQSTIVWLVYDRDAKLCTMEEVPPMLEVDLIDINKTRDGWISEITFYLVNGQNNKNLFNNVVDRRK